MSAMTALRSVGRSDHTEKAGDVVALHLVNDTAETSPAPLALVDDAPHVYHVTQRKALAMRTAALRKWEAELQRQVNRWRRLGIHSPRDFVRLYAVRHVLEDRGETLEDV